MNKSTRPPAGAPPGKLPANLPVEVVEEGHVVCCTALMATLYFDGRAKGIRKQVASAFDVVRRALGENLRWGADPKTGRPRKLAGTTILELSSWVDKLGPSTPLELAFHGAERKDDASPFAVKALVQGGEDEGLSHFSWSMPWLPTLEATTAVFRPLVAEICDLIRPRHGYAGLGALTHVGVHGGSDEVAAAVKLVKRYRGLEIDFPESHSIYLSEQGTIKGVNWLTVLSDQLVMDLGGIADLQKALGGEVLVQRWKGGVTLQAGDLPLWGDRNRKEKMPAYARVARALSPIRARALDSIAPWAGLDEDETVEWLARFDGEEGA